MAGEKSEASGEDNSEGEVLVHLVPLGGAPRLQKDRLLVPKTWKVATFCSFLTSRIEDRDPFYDKRIGKRPLHLFLTQGFAPNPENTIGNLFDLFENETTQELCLKYSFQLMHG